MNKDDRQKVIRELIASHRLSSQDEIIQAAADKGLGLTQASVSRDLRELGAVKVDGYYRTYTAQNGAGQSRETGSLSGLVTNVDTAGSNLIVVKTAVGAASSIAVALDSRQLGEVVGTLAGDDTIFIAVRSRAAQGSVLSVLDAWKKGGVN